MSVPFAINGLGRVGRALLRIAHRRDDLRVVAVNDLVPAAELAALLARDSVHGRFPGTVTAEGSALVVDGRKIPVSAAPEPAACPWRGTGARFVVEATGRFLARDRAVGHLQGEGAGSPAHSGSSAGSTAAAAETPQRVILSANSADADVTLCLGVNTGRGVAADAYDPAHHRVVSNSSCTTNCMAPLLAVLDRVFGVERGVMSTVHSYTGNQRLLDSPHPEPRRRRAAGANIIPVATTAPAALGRLMPGLAGRVTGVSVRVPTPMAAMMELAVDVATDASADAVRDAFREAAGGGHGAALARVLAVTEEDLVSSDFIGSPYSAVVDLPLVDVVDRRLVRIVAWYDNEVGYANRLADLLVHLAAVDAGG